MTPLAQALMRRALDLRTLAADRKLVRDLLYCAHLFDVTEIFPLVVDIQADLDEKKKTFYDYWRGIFLPFPKTWVEMRNPRGKRYAYLYEQNEDDIQVSWVTDSAVRLVDVINCGGVCKTTGRLKFDGPGPYAGRLSDRTNWEWDDEFMKGYAFADLFEWAMVLLLFINTPRHIGRRTHAPHRGLEREILKRRKLVGQFPLHAWTEIKLEVTKPMAFDDSEHEGHLTGQKCFHWVRAHCRVRLGQLEFVKHHSRGDAALGIKQSRYLVT